VIGLGVGLGVGFGVGVRWIGAGVLGAGVVGAGVVGAAVVGAELTVGAGDTVGVGRCDTTLVTGTMTAAGGLEMLGVAGVGLVGATSAGLVGAVAGVTDGEAEGAGVVDGCGVGRAEALRGTTTTGAPTEFGEVTNGEFDAALWLTGGAIALDPITTTLAVAAVVTPTRRPATTTVFVVVAAKAEGRWKPTASFIVGHLPWAVWRSAVAPCDYSIRSVPTRSLRVAGTSEWLIVMAAHRHKSTQT
jgi:hypothetical protein